MSLDFETTERVSSREIVEAWPRDESSPARLLLALERALIDFARSMPRISVLRWARTGATLMSLPSPLMSRTDIVPGFYPIVRVMADLWEGFAQVAPERARSYPGHWGHAAFLLPRRLAIFAASNAVHPAADLAEMIMGLNDHDFWVSGAQVELMRGLVARWDEFSPQARANIEGAVRGHAPSSVCADAFDDEDRWTSFSTAPSTSAQPPAGGRRTRRRSTALSSKSQNAIPKEAEPWRSG